MAVDDVTTVSLVGATIEAHDEGVVALPLETWVSVGTLLGVGVTLLVAVRSGFTNLRTEFKADVLALEGRVTRRLDDLSIRIDEQTSRINELDRRVYELATGLRPLIDQAREGNASGQR